MVHNPVHNKSFTAWLYYTRTHIRAAVTKYHRLGNCLHTHLDRWPNWVPCSCRIDIAFSCWMSARGHSQLLEAFFTFCATWPAMEKLLGTQSLPYFKSLSPGRGPFLLSAHLHRGLCFLRGVFVADKCWSLVFVYLLERRELLLSVPLRRKHSPVPTHSCSVLTESEFMSQLWVDIFKCLWCKEWLTSCLVREFE